MEQKEIKAIIECLLFVSDKPLPVGTIQSLMEDVDRRTILACLDELKAEYDVQGRAFHLVEIAEGYQLATRVQFAPWIRKMFKSRTNNKLSRAALETLAIIAYRQPITKAEIEDIRGVSADGVVNALLDRKFIRIVGRKEVVGRPILYGTTKEFLHYFGLKDLTDMPLLKDLQDILDSDDTGKAWELNAQGELVAKIRVGEDAENQDADNEGAPLQEAAESATAVADPEQSAPDAALAVLESEALSEGGNGKSGADLELAGEEALDEDIDLEEDDEELGAADEEEGDENNGNGGHSHAADLVPDSLPAEEEDGKTESDERNGGAAGDKPDEEEKNEG